MRGAAGMSERWLPVPGWDGYDVSDLGRVRSWRVAGSATRRSSTARILAFGVKAGYPTVDLCRPGASQVFTIHALVTLAFLGARPTGLEVRHLDGDRRNNTLANLAYGTHAENAQDSIRHGTFHFPNPHKAFCVNGHAMSGANLRVTSRGFHSCRECGRAANRRRYRSARQEVA